MIGSLLYLCASRPNIMLSVCMCARFQANPKECHLMAVKRIFRYLVFTPNLGLWYPKGSTFTLLGYSNSDYASCRVKQKSSKKQLYCPFHRSLRPSQLPATVTPLPQQAPWHVTRVWPPPEDWHSQTG